MLAQVFVFPFESVTVIVVSVPSRPPEPTVQLQEILPVLSAGFGVQLIHGILTVAPSSTAERLRETFVPSFAGLGERAEAMVGVLGAVVSTTSTVLVSSVAAFP